jgi:hypothetical protein
VQSASKIAKISINLGNLRSAAKPRSRFEVPQSGTKTLPPFEFLSFKKLWQGEFSTGKFLRGGAHLTQTSLFLKK